jgi:acetoacetyl-CoA synthetase
MKVETFDDNGHSVINEVGELVCTAPFPSRPLYFLNDNDGSKYHDAYFNRYPGVWHHGDFIKINNHGGVIVYGRSDATLNPGGVRIGTAEIYGPVESMEEINDSIVVTSDNNIDSEIILFVVLNEGFELTDEIHKKIKERLKLMQSPRHVPSKIYQVSDIPRTLNGKKVELAVAKIINGENIDNKEAIANPDILNEFSKFRPNHEQTTG